MEYLLLMSEHLIGDGQWMQGKIAEDQNNTEVLTCQSNQKALSINVYTTDPTYLKTLFPGGSKP